MSDGRTCILPGNDADARGRNGVFRPAYIDVRPLGQESECDVEITATSKRIGDIPPLGLRLNRNDARLLVKAITAAINEVNRLDAYAAINRRRAEIAAAKPGEASEHESPAPA